MPSELERAVLTAMRELGMLPGRPHRKVARVLARVLGRPPRSVEADLHAPRWEESAVPDVAAYAAVVRLVQPFRTRYPLVEGRGNFGTIDGDPPADLHYTEARLTPLGVAVLEGAAPHHLLNHPLPHHLGELARAATATDLEALVAAMPGPDFPTGGLVDAGAVRAVYASGRGTLWVRPRLRAERGGFVVTEIPWGARKSALVLDLARRFDVRDESDREGVRVRVRGASAAVLEAELVRPVAVDGPPILAQLGALDATCRAGLARLAAVHADARRTTIVVASAAAPRRHD